MSGRKSADDARRSLEALGVFEFGASGRDIELMVEAFEDVGPPSRYIDPGEGSSAMPGEDVSEGVSAIVARLEQRLRAHGLLLDNPALPALEASD